MSADITIEPWTDEGGLELLRRTNVPELMRHLGGPESEEKLEARHRRYLDGTRTGTARMFRIAVSEHPEGVGAIGYWEKLWHDQAVYEAGWSVQSEWHDRGIATAALLAMLEHAASVGSRRFLHAFPEVGNGASNAICRKAGLEFRGTEGFEYPVGHPIRANDWAFDLRHEK